jgi:hypothetical protein
MLRDAGYDNELVFSLIHKESKDEFIQSLINDVNKNSLQFQNAVKSENY